MLSIPPKYSVSYVVGYIKGKSAIHIARTYDQRQLDLPADDNYFCRLALDADGR
jgi:REP element-mobilizing transposase RayT